MMCLAPTLYYKGRRAWGCTLVQGVKSHANSHRICVVSTQKDSRGCGACRMATVYCTVESFDSKSKSHHETYKNKETPQGTGVFLLFSELATWWLLVG